MNSRGVSPDRFLSADNWARHMSADKSPRNSTRICLVNSPQSVIFLRFGPFTKAQASPFAVNRDKLIRAKSVGGVAAISTCWIHLSTSMVLPRGVVAFEHPSNGSSLKAVDQDKEAEEPAAPIPT